MKSNLLHIQIPFFKTYNGTIINDLPLSYQVFGKKLGTAPIILINHALTGNSNVAGKNGWWIDIVGNDKIIDTNLYTIISFNIPGNGFDGHLINDYKNFIARDIASIFLLGLDILNIKKLFALIGGSLGGGIAWEMSAINPEITENLLVIATDWKATDWLIANCQIQELFLNNSKNPVHDARMHAMLCYRTPESFKKRFKRSKNENLAVFNVESWLLHHGEKLQQRFQLAAYKLMNQLLKTIDVTKDRNNNILENIQANIHIIGVNSDLFFTASENRETYKQLAQNKGNITYNEIVSDHGHDAFLIEYKQLEKIIAPLLNSTYKQQKMKIIKFGGKSLANGKGLKQVISIIKNKIENKEKIAIVVSARGNSTDILEEILEKAKNNEPYQLLFEIFKKDQEEAIKLDYSEEYNRLQSLFDGVALLSDYTLKIKDEVLSFGEILSAKTIVAILKSIGINANVVDTRKLIKTDTNFGNAQPLLETSSENIQRYFKAQPVDTIQVVTGFIATTKQGETTTLGRNGSNYTASLLANFLDAIELQNFTHVDGIYTANPDLVPDAKKIQELSFNEANEMANFGATILHAKTIIPLLEKNINLRILNTFKPNEAGTLITAQTKAKTKGIKSIAVLNNVALLSFEGRGLLGKSGVDARIFGALGKKNISVSIISQGSSERGIGLVVDKKNATQAVIALKNEFENDFYTNDVNNVHVNNEVSVISMIGLNLNEFHKPYAALIKNQITPILFNNTVTGKNVSLVVHKKQLNKAINVIHGQIFGVAKKVNIAVFGVGLVGKALVNQILNNTSTILKKRAIQLNIFAVANSKKVLLDKNGISSNWEDNIENKGTTYTLQDIINYAEKNHLENLIAIDNTADKIFVQNYISLIQAGFDLVSSNKIANTQSFKYYKELRNTLAKNKRSYLYETNVGAGLPLIDTIKLLHESGENITKIKGVFSGSLSYLFNTFSAQNIPFSDTLKEAINLGFTEPDPREDLCGNDVARKLLILARELDLENEFEDIAVENLIPTELREVPLPTFLSQLTVLDSFYQKIKDAQKENHVLRYIGELSGNLFEKKGNLHVQLVSVPKTSPLGGLKGSDAIFEIYTESYGEHPIVIQGAGAGANVTARGVFGDILRLVKHNG